MCDPHDKVNMTDIMMLAIIVFEMCKNLTFSHIIEGLKHPESYKCILYNETMLPCSRLKLVK